jgi:hypothetical protein
MPNSFPRAQGGSGFREVVPYETKADNTQTGSIELRQLGLFFATFAFYQWAIN